MSVTPTSSTDDARSDIHAAKKSPGVPTVKEEASIVEESVVEEEPPRPSIYDDYDYDYEDEDEEEQGVHEEVKVKVEEQPYNWEDHYVFPPGNFIKVIYGDNRTLLVNPDSRKGVFMDFIKRGIGATNMKGILDLLNEDGCVLGIRNHHRWDSVLHYFTPRSIYLPCSITVDSNGVASRVEPLLLGWKDIFPDMQDNLEAFIQTEKTAFYMAKSRKQSPKEKDKDKKEDRQKDGEKTKDGEKEKEKGKDGGEKKKKGSQISEGICGVNDKR